jgi:hypothetical protein
MEHTNRPTNTTEEITMNATIACPFPGCDTFPFDRVDELSAHILTHTTTEMIGFAASVAPAPQGTNAAPTTSGRFQTQANGFGGTTTVKAPPVRPAHLDIDGPTLESMPSFVALVLGSFQDRKFNDIDVTANLRDLAINWLGVYTGNFEFVTEMQQAMMTKGNLSTGQVRGVLNCMRADVLREAKRALATPGAAPAAEVAFDLRTLPESAHGVLHVAVPDHTTGEMVFLAIAQRRNGKVVVLQEVGGNDDLYLGQQFDGQAYKGKRVAELEAVLADPQKAIAAYGHHFTRCGICNTQLTDAHSIEMGIGPKCAAKAGW